MLIKLIGNKKIIKIRNWQLVRKEYKYSVWLLSPMNKILYKGKNGKILLMLIQIRTMISIFISLGGGHFYNAAVSTRGLRKGEQGNTPSCCIPLFVKKKIEQKNFVRKRAEICKS